MKGTRLFIPLACLLSALLINVSAACADQAADKNGQALFEQHCSLCHSSGGNIINPAKTLDKETLAANGIHDAADIIATLRKPGPGMPPFDKDLIPDDEAQQIADYILETF